MFEDPHRNRDEQNALYTDLLEHDAQVLRELVGPSNALSELTQQVSGFGDANRARAAHLDSVIDTTLGRRDAETFDIAVRENDPQQAFAAAVRLRERALAGETDRFVRYLQRDWSEAGPARAYNLWIGMEETQASLEFTVAQSQRLHFALIRASYRPAGQLSEADRSLLARNDFIEDNGDYAIPDHFRLTPTTVASAFADVTDTGRLAAVDRVLNAEQAGLLLATVALPGGAAGYLGEAVTLELLGTRLGATLLGRALAYGAGVSVDAAASVGLTRAAQVATDPALLLRDGFWTLDAIGKEFLQNLLLIGVLKTYRGGVVAESVAKGGLLTDAGAATLLGGFTDPRQWSWDAYTSNVLTLLLQKGMNVAPDSPGLRYARYRAQRLAENRRAREDPEQARRDAGDRQAGDPARARSTREVWGRFWAWVDSDYIPARRLMNGFDGNWKAARKAFLEGRLSREQMTALTALRERVVDSLAREIIDELGGTVLAFGSKKTTSDYDISFAGPLAEVAVTLFNARFRARWGLAVDIGGAETAGRLDTNTYTSPRYADARGGESDVWVQDAFAHLAARKLVPDAESWAAYRNALLERVPEAHRETLRSQLDEAEAMYERFETAIGDRMREIEAGGENLAPDELRVAAENRLYEDNLREVLARYNAWTAARGGQRDALAQELRNAQAQALYFAQEPYYTHAAIEHVVMSLQAAGRKITVESLLSPELPPEVAHLTPQQGRRSYLEQIAKMYHELAAEGDPAALASKGAKYFIRALDASRVAGVDLSEHRAIIEATIEIEANRSEIPVVKEVLKKHFGDAANGERYIEQLYRLASDLAVQTYASAPFEPTAPVIAGRVVVGQQARSSSASDAAASSGAGSE